MINIRNYITEILSVPNLKKSRWEDNIKMYLQEVGSGCGDWMELAQDRDRWRALCEYGNELSGFHKMRGIS